MKVSFRNLATCFTMLAALGLTAGAATEPAHGTESKSDNDVSTTASIRVPEKITRTADGAALTKAQMVDDLAKNRVIYIAETHDNLMAHHVQAEIIEMLAQRYPGKVVVAMEMFRDTYQPVLDQWAQGNIPDETFEELFKDTWRFDPEIYKAVLQTIFKNDIPVIGLRPGAALEKAFDNGEPANYPAMDQNDSLHRQFNMMALASLAGAHGHSKQNKQALEKIYQKQLLRDEGMGEEVAEFLDDPANDDKILVVIAGTQHVSYGLGIPKRADRRHAHDYAIVLATSNDMTREIERIKDGKRPSIPPAGDYVWNVPYIKLEDVQKLKHKQQPAPAAHHKHKP